MGGAVVRTLASHQCSPGSIPEPGVMCGFSLLLVLIPTPSIFLLLLQFSFIHKNQHFKFQFDREYTVPQASSLILQK